MKTCDDDLGPERENGVPSWSVVMPLKQFAPNALTEVTASPVTVQFSLSASRVGMTSLVTNSA
ncbi:hypothetical protein GCM10023190_18210 [Enteractinococcus fodinae]